MSSSSSSEAEAEAKTALTRCCSPKEMEENLGGGGGGGGRKEDSIIFFSSFSFPLSFARVEEEKLLPLFSLACDAGTRTKLKGSSKEEKTHGTAQKKFQPLRIVAPISFLPASFAISDCCSMSVDKGRAGECVVY